MVYKEYGPPEGGPGSRHRILLTREAVPVILSVFGLEESAGGDLYRAVEQARVRVGSGRGEL